MLEKPDTRDRILDASTALVLQKGFTAMSIDDVLAATSLTKGGFFYHFKSKQDLAKALIQRFSDVELQFMIRLFRRAEELSDDPLQQMLIYLKLLQEEFRPGGNAATGCLFAAYCYEAQQFDESVLIACSTGVQDHRRYVAERMDRILARYQPAYPVTGAELSDQLFCVIQGAFVVARSVGDTQVIVRQIELARELLKLLFRPAS